MAKALTASAVVIGFIKYFVNSSQSFSSRDYLPVGKLIAGLSNLSVSDYREIFLLSGSGGKAFEFKFSTFSAQ